MKEIFENHDQAKIFPVFKRFLEFITEDIDIYLFGENTYVK